MSNALNAVITGIHSGYISIAFREVTSSIVDMKWYHDINSLNIP